MYYTFRFRSISHSGAWPMYSGAFCSSRIDSETWFAIPEVHSTNKKKNSWLVSEAKACLLIRIWFIFLIISISACEGKTTACISFGRLIRDNVVCISHVWNGCDFSEWQHAMRFKQQSPEASYYRYLDMLYYYYYIKLYTHKINQNKYNWYYEISINNEIMMIYELWL